MRSQLLRHHEQGDTVAVGLDSADSKSPSLLRRLGHLLAWVGLILQIRRERNQLAQLNDHQLRDIGITREQAGRESFKGLTSIPPNRLKPTRAFRRR